MHEANDGQLRMAARSSPTDADKRGHQKFHLLPIGMSQSVSLTSANRLCSLSR
jgi:hypothetical protein